jgi:hypothetical protein
LENTDYVSRAKALIQSHARTAALVIVPLAAAVSAHAGSVTLPTSNFSCSVDSNDGFSNCTSGGAGVSQTSGGGVSFYLSSGGAFLAGDGTVTEGSSGSVAGAIAAGSLIPYSIDIGFGYFTLDPNYSLEIEVRDLTTHVNLVDSTFSGSYTSGSSIDQSGSFTTLASSSAGDDLRVEYILTLSNVPGNGRTTVTVPQGESVDLGPVSNATAPEPASVGLMGGGLAWLAYQWRKRRKS